MSFKDVQEGLLLFNLSNYLITTVLSEYQTPEIQTFDFSDTFLSGLQNTIRKPDRLITGHFWTI